MSRRQRTRGEAYRTRRFIRRHPDLVANAVEVASRSALADVVAPFIGRAAAERLVDSELSGAPAPRMQLPPALFRNITGQTLESAALDNLEYRGPNGEVEPLVGLAVYQGRTIEEALLEELAKRGEGWSVWFVTPGAPS